MAPTKPRRTTSARRSTKRPSTARKQTTASKSPKTSEPATPPAASVAAAQKLLRAVERREEALREALKQHTKALKKLKKDAADHRGVVKDLQTQVKKVKEAAVRGSRPVKHPAPRGHRMPGTTPRNTRNNTDQSSNKGQPHAHVIHTAPSSTRGLLTGDGPSARSPGEYRQHAHRGVPSAPQP